MYRSLITLTAMTLIAGAAYAQSDQDNQSPGERRGPPKEAIEACSNSEQGDSCSFEGQRGDTLQGNCEAPPDEKALACRPEGGPPNNQLERS